MNENSVHRSDSGRLSSSRLAPKNNTPMIIVVLCIFGFMSAIVITGVVAYISNANYGNEAEKQIVAEYTNMENILAQYSLKVQEVAQVPDMKTDDLARITKESMSGRYGENGSQAVFQWLQENYPGSVTDTLYAEITQVMKAGRDKFENAQSKFIDTKRVYEVNLGYIWKGFWLRLAGYPKINLEDFQIISSEHAIDAFKTGVDKGIKLRD